MVGRVSSAKVTIHLKLHDAQGINHCSCSRCVMPGCDVACGYGSKIGENLERRHLQETTIKATWEVSRSALALRCPVLTQVLTLSGQEASCTDDAGELSYLPARSVWDAQL